jgi:large subunit ribosomal protein L21
MGRSKNFHEDFVMYAVIKSGGKQHRVTPGEVLTIEKLAGSKGDQVVFDQVLMVADNADIRIGAPVVEGAKVIGEILEQKKGPKINIFKMKRRKGSKKKTGHRQQLTSMKVKEISV